MLVQLAEAPERRLRMTELAAAVLLSRSGVTRLVDRLEKVGLVARCRVAGDGRGVAAELTPAGLNRLRNAAPTHLAGVVRHFVRPAGRRRPGRDGADQPSADRLTRAGSRSAAGLGRAGRQAPRAVAGGVAIRSASLSSSPRR